MSEDTVKMRRRQSEDYYGVEAADVGTVKAREIVNLLSTEDGTRWIELRLGLNSICINGRHMDAPDTLLMVRHILAAAINSFIAKPTLPERHELDDAKVAERTRIASWLRAKAEAWRKINSQYAWDIREVAFQIESNTF
jgi:hypothetical protein